MQYVVEILIAVIAFVGALVGAFVSNNTNQKVMAHQIKELEKKVDKHNNLVERLTRLEARVEKDEGKMVSGNVDGTSTK